MNFSFEQENGHGLKAHPLKDIILGSNPSVNRKLLAHILTNIQSAYGWAYKFTLAMF